MPPSPRRRIALLFVPLAVALWMWVPNAPAEHALRLHLGARPAAVRTVDLRFQRDDSVARSLTLSFPDGASGDVTRTVRLAKGDYQVGARVVRTDGSQYGTTQWEHVDGDGVVDLDLTK